MIENLFKPLGTLKGVGPKTVANFATLNINNIYDLLYYFPVKYDELKQLPLSQVLDGQKVVLKGQIVTPVVMSRFGYKKARLSFKLKIDHEIIMVNFFNQPWLKQQLAEGQEIAVYGKYNEAKQSLSGLKIMAIKDEQNELAPIYTKNQHVKQKKLIEVINEALVEYLPEVVDVVPSAIRQKYRLLNEQQIVKGMQKPKNPLEAKAATRSAIFREFFLFQMQLGYLNRGANQGSPLNQKWYQQKYIAELRQSLPFELSADQDQVLSEILADLQADHPMNRLLEGDVGSGKTVVAILTAFAAITAGKQVAVMVPTEILAQQHFENFKNILSPFGVSVALLTGSTSNKTRQAIQEQLAAGQINCLIGTHALIQNQVFFKDLGYVIIDEQHRFGVNQRKQLIQKGEHVDVLAMTATPIPRTLALTVYGNMDVSMIKTLPKGRLPIISAFKTSAELPGVLAQMREQLAQGFQVYVVTPLISESEQLDLQNAELIYQKMQDYFGKDYRVALLHGQMASAEKDQVMEEFVQHQSDILVTTSVIEVGVDVKNANLMVIFDADRFGLSQLHQLRGRIGRGQTQAYCYFVADPKSDSGRERMEIIAGTNDGFELAEADLKMRGQGDVFGKKQSGLPVFQVGDVITDFNTLVEAKKTAQEILASDPELEQPEVQNLKQVIEYKNQEFRD